MSAPKCWSYAVGQKGVNRVRVREREPGGVLFIEWYENGKRIRKSFRQFCGTHITDKQLAVRTAQKFAERTEDGDKSALADQLMSAPKKIGSELSFRERMALPADELFSHRLPTEPLCGIYFLLSGEEVSYVGQSRDVMARLAHHRRSPPAPFDAMAFQAFPPDQLDRAEAVYIDRFDPPGNRQNPRLISHDMARLPSHPGGRP